MADIMGIGEAVNSKVVEKAYDDILSKPAKQAGEFAEDVFKAFRLLSFPVQIAATAQDKFRRILATASNAVPQERRIDLQPQTIPSILQIAGPIYEHIKYMDENIILFELFEELLARSIDSERISEAHPSFICIISQLSRDEAIILLELRRNDFDFCISFCVERETNRIVNKKVDYCSFPADKLLFSGNFEMYCDHLEKLGVVGQTMINNDSLMDEHHQQIGNKQSFKIYLTHFGRFFVHACVPKKGFRNK